MNVYFTSLICFLLLINNSIEHSISLKKGAKLTLQVTESNDLYDKGPLYVHSGSKIYSLDARKVTNYKYKRDLCGELNYDKLNGLVSIKEWSKNFSLITLTSYLPCCEL